MIRQDELLEIVRKARAGEYEVIEISPDKVNVDMRLYPRETLSMERASLFAEMMDQGEKFPSVWLAEDRSTCIDGAHRTYGNRQRGARSMSAMVLPVSDMKDIMDLSVLANTIVAHTPLQKGDIRRILQLLLNALADEHTDIREGIKARYGSMEALARFWGVPSNAVSRIAQGIELLREGKIQARPKPQEPPARRPGPQVEEGAWGKEETATLPEQVVRTVLAVPAGVQEIPQQSPWDYLAQVTVRFLKAITDLVPAEVADVAGAEPAMLERISEALMKLGKADRDFVLHYRDRLAVFASILDVVEE